ncbi:hypothetical protein GGD83_000020 [Rhodoblastus sphagnicola]|nr:hypothetical protein [Rhodoblastus sphagnicola]MBB4196249.1 hypothetical protein [Rhodoblastus sphagnicola]
MKTQEILASALATFGLFANAAFGAEGSVTFGADAPANPAETGAEPDMISGLRATVGFAALAAPFWRRRARISLRQVD